MANKSKIMSIHMLEHNGDYCFENSKGKTIANIGPWYEFEKLFPQFRIRRNERLAVRLAYIKNGIKLVKL